MVIPRDKGTRRTVVTDSNQLRTIVDRIHDRWFDPQEIVFGRERAILTVPFVERTASAFWSRATKKIKSIRPFGFLKISHVSSYHIHDTEKVGLYDFNKFSYDARSKRSLC